MLASSLKKKLSGDEIVVGTFLTFNFWAGHLEIEDEPGLARFIECGCMVY